MDQSIPDEYDVLILDPASTEFNRGSFCYLPYIVYSHLKATGHKVKLIEDFTIAEIDNLPPAKKIIVSLWSYPQIESCIVLNRFLDVEFFGYYPLIEDLRLPIKKITNEEIKIGISAHPYYYSDFKYLLLSDCDMHMNKYEGTVYPMFTSYGCPKNCSFCPSSVNCDRTRIELNAPTVISMLRACRDQGIHNIHFTDEDFFMHHERTAAILRSQVEHDMNFIALGSVSAVQRFIDIYGEKLLIDSGVKIIEVGFETGDTELSKTMNKPSLSTYEKLAESCKTVDILWLALTFFPGETIKTLNETGNFFRKHGMKIDQLYGRIATNGTEGGLGQFMQVYHGVKDYHEIMTRGEPLTMRPMRLIPSYIPHSFSNSVIEEIEMIPGNQKWFDLYLKKSYQPPILVVGETIANHVNIEDDYVFLAICARLGIIK